MDEALEEEDDDILVFKRVGQRGALFHAKVRPELPLSAPQKLLLLEWWHRIGLPARLFLFLVNVARQMLSAWKRRFDKLRPGGMIGQPKRVKQGGMVPDITKRTILLRMQSRPE